MNPAFIANSSGNFGLPTEFTFESIGNTLGWDGVNFWTSKNLPDETIYQLDNLGVPTGFDFEKDSHSGQITSLHSDGNFIYETSDSTFNYYKYDMNGVFLNASGAVGTGGTMLGITTANGKVYAMQAGGGIQRFSSSDASEGLIATVIQSAVGTNEWRCITFDGTFFYVSGNEAGVGSTAYQYTEGFVFTGRKVKIETPHDLASEAGLLYVTASNTVTQYNI